MARRPKQNKNKSNKNSKNNSSNMLLQTRSIIPLTDNQRNVFMKYTEGKNLVLSGMAGTGKTFCALYLALLEVLDSKSTKNKIYIVRSIVPTRNVGFLPGTLREKVQQYESPYSTICKDLLGRGDAYEILKGKNIVEFLPTSFIRGETYDDCVVIVDEMQNLTFHELDSVITRMGDNSRIIFSGDYRQSDLTTKQERDGLSDFLTILDYMEDFSKIEFGADDVVRSGMVKRYLISKDKLFP